MRVYFVRHPKPKVDPGVCYGQLDLDLSQDVKSSAQQVKEFFSGAIPSRVVSSDLMRCSKLARELSGGVSLDSRLRELDFGEWEGKSWDEIPRSESDYWAEDWVNRAPPGGESFLLLTERVLDWWYGVERQTDGDMLVVTHAGVLRVLFTYFYGWPWSRAFELKFDFLEVTEMVLVHLHGELLLKNPFSRLPKVEEEAQ